MLTTGSFFRMWKLLFGQIMCMSFSAGFYNDVMQAEKRILAVSEDDSVVMFC